MSSAAIARHCMLVPVVIEGSHASPSRYPPIACESHNCGTAVALGAVVCLDEPCHGRREQYCQGLPLERGLSRACCAGNCEIAHVVGGMGEDISFATSVASVI